MQNATPRLVLVDTNCFLRLYCSPVMPLLQQDVGGYRLMTLQSLIEEFVESKRLCKLYPWIAKGPKLEDLRKAALQVDRGVAAGIKESMRELRLYSNEFLANYCQKRKLKTVKSLSSCDVELLASAVVMKGVVATDEWPLSEVVRDLMGDPDDDYEIGLFSSFDVLHLLEKEGLLARDMRIQTCETWLRVGESLPRDWRKRYETLFDEESPPGA